MPNYFFGQGGSVKLGASSPFTVCVKEWSSTVNFNVQDLTTTCSNGFMDRGTGIKSMEATFTGFYDPNTNITMTDFCTGSYIVLAFELGNSGSSLSGTFLVNSFKVTNPAEEYITVEVSVQSSGAFVISEL